MVKKTLKRVKAKSWNISWRPLIVLGLILFAIFGGLWWAKIVMDPERAFWAMMDRNLQTTSVTRSIAQTNQGASLDQRTRLQFQPAPRTQVLTTISQTSGKATNQVTTESIGTASADYTRYASIKTTQARPDGKPFNFSSLLGVWARSDSGSSGQTGYLQEAIIAAVPFGQLSPADRHKLIDMMHATGVYQADFKQVSRQWEQGKPQLVYKVKLRPEAYAQLLKAYGQILHLNSVTELSTQQYKGAADVDLEMTVDALSRQLLRVKYLAGERIENFSSYGQSSLIMLPEHTVSATELQKRLAPLVQ